MELLNSIMSWVMAKRMHQIELFMKYPHEVQNEWFQQLISTAKHTQWGEKHKYASIKNIEQYKQRVPVQEYHDVEKYILEIKHGKQNVLWPTEIKTFAKSSGTTSAKSKFIPVSKESLENCHFKGGKDMFAMYYHNFPNSKLYVGKGLVIGGSSQVNQFSNDSYYGDLSAIIIQNLPFWVEMKRTPKASIALMDKWEEKIEKMTHVTSRQNVTHLSGVPSWMLVLLKRILEITGKNNIKEVWPNLELYIHGGVSFAPYKKQYEQLIPSDKMHYMETYNASEGFFGIQDQPFANDMLLMLDYGIYYEFMPMEELGKSEPKTLQLHEVETGKNYALVISTNAGLWRYMIGDTIKFTSLNPFRIVVTGRTRHFINAFGEELIIENAEKALQTACSKTNATIKDYTAAPVYMHDNAAGAHEWLIEFETPPHNIAYFAELLDNALKAVNSDYEAKRYKGMALKMPLIRLMPQGTFYNWMKKRGKLGGQNKVPRLANHRQYVDEINAMIDKPIQKHEQAS